MNNQPTLQAEIACLWKLLYRPGQIVELRAPKAGRYKTVSGYFDNPDDLAQAAQQWNGETNLYITLNELNPALFARSVNQAKPYAETTTADSDILRRRWLFADFDPVRPSGISASEEEHSLALERAEECAAWLEETFGIACLRADSGNGGHLLLPIDLPNDTESARQCEAILTVLEWRFGDESVKVDQSVYNAARICKLYGTKAVKGSHTPDRPHRVSRLLSVPSILTPVSVETLQKIAALAPKPQASPQDSRHSAGRFDLKAFLAEHGIRVHRELPYKEGTRYQLETCPFNAEHRAPDAAVFQFSNGSLGFHCLHDSCRDKEWKDFRERFEPGYQQAREAADAQDAPRNRGETGQGKPFPSSASVRMESPPDPLDEEAFHGIAGDFVRLVEPHTEGDLVGMLVQFLVAYGNIIGRNAWYTIEATQHYGNLFAVLVGQSAKGRKGTSWDRILEAFRAVDEEWADTRVMSGLSSGEGLLYAVRDSVEVQEPIKEKGKITGYQTVVKDQGEEDKRLLVPEAEFSRTLRVMEREGNTLSALLRHAWDTGKLRVMTKNALKATGAHISIIGHITRDELRQCLTSTEAANGFANRFLWVYVKRSKFLPHGGSLTEQALQPYYNRIADAIEFGRKVRLLERDAQARAEWERVYPLLEEDTPGLLGAVTARSSAIVLRLSCLYALLDKSDTIRSVHQRAALAVWNYCEQSARYIFGDALGDPVADAILQALRNTPEGLTRKQISDLFGRNHKAERLQEAFRLLHERRLATYKRIDTDGRPAEIWTATGTSEETRL